ncbi:hypothetical protein ACIBSS_33845, partial [Micromonospora aurantiaca]|uniref:hypothetical protein n=1 Tax=Micromonospora aurantiaca (nom. illeg.) TaxID=47850 RepID=UPI0037B623DA
NHKFPLQGRHFRSSTRRRTAHLGDHGESPRLTLAYLAAYKVVDKTLVALPIHYRLERVWGVIEPHVQGERKLRGSHFSYMNFLEDFVTWVKDQDIPNNPSKFRIHGFFES